MDNKVVFQCHRHPEESSSRRMGCESSAGRASNLLSSKDGTHPALPHPYTIRITMALQRVNLISDLIPSTLKEN